MTVLHDMVRQTIAPQTAVIPEVPCLYEVNIGHARTGPVAHAFRHTSYMWLFDLDDPPRLPIGLGWLARYRAADHVDVRGLLRSAGIEVARVVVLTNLRVLGYVFNPISVHWCFDRDGVLVAHVAEVHNTYGGRHAYILPVDGGPADHAAGPVDHAAGPVDHAAGPVDHAACPADHAAGVTVPKAMYVSPFNPVDGDYRIRIGDPAETLRVSVTLDRHDGKPFRATLTGSRRDADTATVIRSFVRHPAAPLRGRALIQLEGLRLWRKGLEIQPR